MATGPAPSQPLPGSAPSSTDALLREIVDKLDRLIDQTKPPRVTNPREIRGD